VCKKSYVCNSCYRPTPLCLTTPCTLPDVGQCLRSLRARAATSFVTSRLQDFVTSRSGLAYTKTGGVACIIYDNYNHLHLPTFYPFPSSCTNRIGINDQLNERLCELRSLELSASDLATKWRITRFLFVINFKKPLVQPDINN
jgi:hypothetical protein